GSGTVRPTVDGHGFGTVVQGSARAMRVEVIDLFRVQACLAAGVLHGCKCRVAFRVRLGEMMRIGSRAVADNFAEDSCTALLSGSEGFQRQHRGPFAQGETVPK